MTSQITEIRSYSEYLIQTYYILVPILVKIYKKNQALMTVFSTI